MSNLTEYLESRGLRFEGLSRSAASGLFSGWCQAFLSEVRMATGSYRYLGLHWHAFSYDLVRAQEGQAALDAYFGLAAQPVIVIPEDWSRGCGVRCSGPELPDLSGCRDDLYVFPESLEWSMAFTHEQPTIGPYYVYRAAID